MAEYPHSLGLPEAEGKDGGRPPPAYSLTSSNRIVTTRRMVFSMEVMSTEL